MKADQTKMVSIVQSFDDNRFYTVQEVAERLNVSPDTARRLFENEPDVVALPQEDAAYKRKYTTLRIPGFVIKRVLRRLSNIGEKDVN